MLMPGQLDRRLADDDYLFTYYLQLTTYYLKLTISLKNVKCTVKSSGKAAPAVVAAPPMTETPTPCNAPCTFS